MVLFAIADTQVVLCHDLEGPTPAFGEGFGGLPLGDVPGIFHLFLQVAFGMGLGHRWLGLMIGFDFDQGGALIGSDKEVREVAAASAHGRIDIPDYDFLGTPFQHLGVGVEEHHELEFPATAEDDIGRVPLVFLGVLEIETSLIYCHGFHRES
jgi:hypothetical protein